MAEVIQIGKISSIYAVNIGGENITLKLYYIRNVDRWAMDISNSRNGTSSNGILINTGENLLSQCGRIGLEVIVAISTPEQLLEATIDNFSEKVVLVYMTYEEYNDLAFDGRAILGRKWE